MSTVTLLETGRERLLLLAWQVSCAPNSARDTFLSLSPFWTVRL